ncbi:MAG: 50S ribosomal protein L13 [Candidatus Nezhaarchaeota archaeon]|nr:50S ribosomal protein L13 [Candidatus Nezhaarchaeota archaeon]
MPLLVVDASDLILGRMASHVAKRLLNGDQVVVVNAEKAVISGSRQNIVEEYKEYVLAKRRLKNPAKGPKKVRRPDLLVKRVIRGMLPYKKAKGREAYRRLKVYIGVPEEFAEHPKVKFEDAEVSRLSLKKYMYVGELSSLFRHGSASAHA